MFNYRRVNAYLFILAIILIGASYYIQYGVGVLPCLLCIIQRYLFFILAIILFISILHRHNVASKWIYNIIILLVELLGVAAAWRHVWLEQTGHNASTCLPPLSFLLHNLPVKETARMIVSGSSECSLVRWTLWGLSPAVWSLVAMTFFTLVTLWQFRRGNTPLRKT